MAFEKNSEYGKLMYDLARRLFPLNRSITGNGVRETLTRIAEIIKINIHEVPTGTKVLDWNVPKEWNVLEAWIKDPKGNIIVDFKNCNLHLLNYSTPIHRKLSLNELSNHVYTLPEYPDWIPYRTSYYNENWGFCMAHRQWLNLKDGEYEVFINSSLSNGHLTYGEFEIKGSKEEEILITTHICHPSLANDNVSGIVVATYLAKILSAQKLNHSFRFLFIPGTIGSITWLSRNLDKVNLIKHGLVLSLLGDNGKFHYKKSRRGDAVIDDAMSYLLSTKEIQHEILEYYPYGYDERQFCSPGFNLPVGRLSRSNHGEFPEYHNSGDDMNFINSSNLWESLNVILDLIRILDDNAKYRNLSPYGEPQLGKRGLFKEIGGEQNTKEVHMAYLWLLSSSDGKNSLLDVAQQSSIPFAIIKKCADRLERASLLEMVDR
jgi:aminopeptidase-like protein